MSLLDTLNNKLKTPYYDTQDDDWIQFLRDHLPYLKQRCVIENITETVMPEVRYNITRFLRKIALPDALWWIVLELNGFRNDMDFDQNVISRNPNPDGIYMKIYVPPLEELDELYQMWLTTSQKRKSGTLASRL